LNRVAASPTTRQARWSHGEAAYWEPATAGCSDHFVLPPDPKIEGRGSPGPLRAPAFLNWQMPFWIAKPKTSPALAFASVSSVFKVRSTRCLNDGVPGTRIERTRFPSVPCKSFQGLLPTEAKGHAIGRVRERQPLQPRFSRRTRPIRSASPSSASLRYRRDPGRAPAPVVNHVTRPDV